MSEQEKKQVKIQVQLTDEMAQGKYSNLAIINHSETEFVLDFLFIQPQAPKATVNSRIVLSPKNAKRLLMMLSENMAKHEGRFGQIVISEPAPTKADLVN